MFFDDIIIKKYKNDIKRQIINMLDRIDLKPYIKEPIDSQYLLDILAEEQSIDFDIKLTPREFAEYLHKRYSCTTTQYTSYTIWPNENTKGDSNG